MAGVSVEGGSKGGRRSLDSEINMIPMIDLLMVTVSFLLITAVWSHLSRLEANAKVPGDITAPPCEGAPCAPEKELHVDMRLPDRFVLSWRQAGTVLTTLDVPRRAVVRTGDGGRSAMVFDDLRAAVAREWQSSGVHRAPSDGNVDRAVLHTAGETRYLEMIAAMDAIYGVTRLREVAGAKPGTASGPAFHVALATN